jgi:hypothetical protein
MTGTITITWASSIENHKGMEVIGDIGGAGHTLAHLSACMEKFEAKKKGCCELIDINEISGISEISEEEKGINNIDKAYLLIVRGGIDILLEDARMNGDDAWDELHTFEWDKKAFMKGRVVNKKARQNVCIADFSQEPDYENKKGTVVDFAELPVMKTLREKLPEFLEEADHLLAEGNYYTDLKKKEVGIGFHGDTERRKVIAMRFGESMDLQYQWFYKSEPVGKRVKVMLNDGDMYVMSEKAVGFDWLKKNTYTLRHAAHNLAKI